MLGCTAMRSHRIALQGPVVTILGRPNVGKSALFNRIVGRRAAIVEDIPGVTRDRNEVMCTYRERTFALVDTGGLDPTASVGITAQIKIQTKHAIDEADVLIVMFDGREGITALDEEIVSLLRKIKKPIFFVVNKIDTPRLESLANEFYGLGMKHLVVLSAEFGIGVDDLMEGVLTALPVADSEAIDTGAETVPRIAVVGRPNVGKSTFINRLLGEDRLMTDSVPGTTRDTIDSLVRYDGHRYLFIDTAGIRRRGRIQRGVERYSMARALSAIGRCDIAVVLMDASEGLVEQDTKIVGHVLQAQKGCILIINKWDLCEERSQERRKIQADLYRKLGFIQYAPLVFISALKGFESKSIFKSIEQVITSYTLRIQTGELNRVFEKALCSNPPPSYRGKTAKLYYITQAQSAPPTFVIFCNDPIRIKESYRRYLVNFLREKFGFIGAPLQLIFRQRRNKS